MRIRTAGRKGLAEDYHALFSLGTIRILTGAGRSMDIL